MRKNSKRSMAVALTMSLFLAGTCSFGAQAGAIENAGNVFSGIGSQVGSFLNDIGIGPALKSAYDAVVDFVFTYQTQPDDSDMELLARSWALTTWLADEDKDDTNIYYFDNDTMTMVEDLTQIRGGYNVSKTPDGSYLNGAKTGILKAVVTDATTYSVEWVNYDDEMNLYLLQQMKSAESETQAQEEGGAEVQSEAKVQSETQVQDAQTG